MTSPGHHRYTSQALEKQLLLQQQLASAEHRCEAEKWSKIHCGWMYYFYLVFKCLILFNFYNTKKDVSSQIQSKSPASQEVARSCYLIQILRGECHWVLETSRDLIFWITAALQAFLEVWESVVQMAVPEDEKAATSQEPWETTLRDLGFVQNHVVGATVHYCATGCQIAKSWSL